MIGKSDAFFIEPQKRYAVLAGHAGFFLVAFDGAFLKRLNDLLAFLNRRGGAGLEFFHIFNYTVDEFKKHSDLAQGFPYSEKNKYLDTKKQNADNDQDNGYGVKG